MNYNDVINALASERKQIDDAIEALQVLTGAAPPAKRESTVKDAASTAHDRKQRRPMSAATKKKISDALRRKHLASAPIAA